MEPQILTRLDADGLLLATIDMPGRSMNVFSDALMDALEALMDRVDSDDAVQAVVITSGKPTFLAGADLVMVRGFTTAARTLDEDALFTLCGRLGRLFVRLEASAKPYVAAVNGLALGGGLELAMACRARVVVDDPAVQLGLPEVRWGLLPGAGGTQRLPRLAGFDAGLSLLLSGRSMTPREALDRRVFAEAVPAAQLLDAARALARSLRGQPYDARAKYPHLDTPEAPAFHPASVDRLARQHGVTAEQLRDYPAYRTIIACVLRGAGQPLAEASATEMRQFLGLMIDPVAGRMIRSLFLNRQRADKRLAAPKALRIEAVTTGPLSLCNADWAAALRGSRLPLREDASLPPNRLFITDNRGRTHAVQADHLAGPDDAVDRARALLTPAGAYGRVLEIITRDDDTAQALAALAPRLGGALPYRSGDGRSTLQRLRACADSPAAQARTALQLLDAGASPDVDDLDVAACAAGLSPAYTGGPFAYLWGHRDRLVPLFDADTLAAWHRQAPVLAAACN